MLRDDPLLREFDKLIEAECYRSAIDIIRDIYAKDAAPELILYALSQRDIAGNSMLMCMLFNDIYLFEDLNAVNILHTLLQRDVPPADILLLLAMHNKQGGNFFHTLMNPSQAHSVRHGLQFIDELLHAAGEQKREFVHAIYQLLTQESHYLVNPGISEKPVDMLSIYNPECMREYLKFVVKLARNGLSREFVDKLLDKKSHSLWPEFWIEAARQTDQQSLKFISSGFLTGAEYQKFVDVKAQLFGCVLKMEDTEKKRTYLEHILDSQHPLGKLYLLKAKSDYRYINKRNGFLKVASDALQHLTPQQMVSGSEKLDVTAAPVRDRMRTMIA